jgi:hypothetical protein
MFSFELLMLKTNHPKETASSGGTLASGPNQSSFRTLTRSWSLA